MFNTTTSRNSLVAASLLLSVSFAHAQSVTMHSELQNMLNEHPRLKAARSAGEAAAWDVERTTDNYFPVFSIYSETGRDKYRSQVTTFGQERKLDRAKATYELRQNLFRGFRDEAAVSASEAEKSIADYTVRKTEQELLLEGANVYIDTLRIKMLGSVVNDKVDVARDLLEIKKRARESGAGTDVDVLEASLAIQKALDEKLLTKTELNSAEVKYKQLYHRDKMPETLQPVALPDKVLPGSVELALQDATERNVELAIARARMDVATSERKNAAGEYYPTLDLVGRRDYDRNLEGQEGARHEKAILLQLNWQFNLGNQAGAAVSAAAEKYSAANFDYHTAMQEIEQRVRLSYERYTNLRDRQKLADETLALAEKVLASREVQRRTGKVDETVVISARARMLSARYTALTSRYEALKAAYELLFATGRLTGNELGLGTN